jgi:hypothetical protein
MILAAIQPKSKPKFRNQFKGECRLCGAKGHKAADFWDNDKNKEKRPSNYKKKTPDTTSTFQYPQKKKLKRGTVKKKVTPWNLLQEEEHR